MPLDPFWRAVAMAGFVGVAAGAAAPRIARAYDHADGPRATADPAADLGGLYGWTTADAQLVIALTTGATYDRDVLFAIHLDRDGDQQPDTSIYVRFGQDAAQAWGVQFSGLPGLADPLEGPVDTVLGDGALQAFAGLRDDPQFVDGLGLSESLRTGTLAFDSRRDTLAGADATAIVLALPLAALGDGPFDLWATSARIGGAEVGR